MFSKNMFHKIRLFGRHKSLSFSLYVHFFLLFIKAKNFIGLLKKGGGEINVKYGSLDLV